MNDLKHTVEDAMSLPSTHLADNAPDVVPSADGPGREIESLEYYRRLHGRHTMWARVALLTVIMGMLVANMWLTQRNYTSLIVNMDHARISQSDLMDRHLAEAEQHRARILALESRVGELEAPRDQVALAK